MKQEKKPSNDVISAGNQLQPEPPGSSELSQGVGPAFCTSVVVSHRCEPLEGRSGRGVCDTHRGTECMYRPRQRDLVRASRASTAASQLAWVAKSVLESEWSSPPLHNHSLWNHLHYSLFYSTLATHSEKAMASHSSTLAWKIPWTEEPGGLQSMGLKRVGHDWATSLSLFTFMHWTRKWQPTPVFLPGESQRRGSLVGCRLWGHTELDTTEAT